MSAAFNSVIDDIYSIFNTTRPIAYGGTGGSSVITGWDGLAAKGTDVASSGTINLTTATGPSITITGTTTITAITLAEGSFRLVRMAGALQFTASATLLVNGSSSVNATTVAEELYIVRGLASGASVAKIGSAGASSATISAQGIVELATVAEALAGTDAVRAVTPNGLYYPTGHLFGLTLSNNGSDATNDIDIAVGTCRDSTDTANIALASAITKRLDAAWAVGTNQGGLDQGSIANATYHKHLIKRVDTGVVDAIYSLSHDKPSTVTMTIASPGVVTWGTAGNGHGLVAGSPFKFSTTGALPTGITAGTQYYVISTGLTETTFQFAASNGGAAINTTGSQSGVHTGLPGPQLPTNYTLFRRIGSIVRAGATILAFTQLGDEFLYAVGVLDVNSVNPGTSAVSRTLSTPVGIKTTALISILTKNTGSGVGFAVRFSALDTTDTAPSLTGVSLIETIYTASSAGNATAGGSDLRIRTNASSQIRSRALNSDGSCTLYIQTDGWIDTRGRQY